VKVNCAVNNNVRKKGKSKCARNNCGVKKLKLMTFLTELKLLTNILEALNST